MVEKIYKKIYSDRLFERQKNTFVTFLFLYLLFSIIIPEGKGIYRKEDLKVDINKASKEEILSIPYIGEKTAEKILYIKKIKGYISVEDLKKIRNYKKFKEFIKIPQ